MSASKTSSQAVRFTPTEHLASKHTLTSILAARDVVNPHRHVELDIDIGADAKDWSAIQVGEKLKPVEAELRRIEEVVAEIVSEMDYLRSREQKLRDTNESTNERVKYFAYITMCTLVALGVWQVVYLRAYFRFVLNPSPRPTSSTDIPLDPSILSRRMSSLLPCTCILLAAQIGHGWQVALEVCSMGAYLRTPHRNNKCSWLIIKFTAFTTISFHSGSI
jgi:hypothetical protein